MRKVVWSVTMTVVLATAVVVAGGAGWRGAQADEHHVVGGDRGWEVSNDIASWSSGRTFTVGDFVWFTYSAAEESIVELGSLEEYISCDLSNPIRLYTDGLDQIALEGEGTRYFTSGKLESCKNGLKLPVTVRSREKRHSQRDDANSSPLLLHADGPAAPSSSTRLNGLLPSLLIGLFLLAIWF
ncbi:unnamed protein product [Cuscuta epithymum]|uniref:Phytocyanin domain-containing protein n=1 Tax=Cuscuta epithymum TaxID=186058 RepID=A0AAV0G2M2_9ASTE|nr:unnamed protein product [Cuscuta epithymum]